MNLLQSTKKRAGSVIHWFISLSLWKKAFFALLLLIVGWFIWSRISGSKSSQPQYQTAVVERGTLISSVSVSGTISSASSAPITTQATGVVAEVNFKNGDFVNQGDTIATLTLDQASQQKQAAAWASYLSATTSLNSAKSRINSLQSAKFKAWLAFKNDKGIDNPSNEQKQDPQYIIEEADWLQAEADYKNQDAIVAQSQAQVSSAYLAYQQVSSTVTAPISGTVSNLKIAAGTPILASTTSSTSNSTSTQTLGNVTLSDAKPQATVNLTEIDVTHIKVGDKATLTLDAFPDKTFTGVVSSIDTNGAVSSGVTTYPTTITFDSAPDNIYPNMGVNADIITNVADNTLIVPTTAIQTVNGTSTVRILKNGQVSQVEVTTGNTSDSETEIKSGLSEGQTVVTSVVTQQSTSTSTSTSLFGGGLGGVRTGGATGGTVRFNRN